MHILFLSDNFPPEVNAPANRTFEHASVWVKEGHKVTVITCFPNFPKGKVFKGYKNKFYSKENINDINVVRVWSFISSNEGIVLRLIDHISFMISSIIASFFIKKYDLVIATSPQFFTAISGSIISFFKRKPWVFEIRDIWSESIIAVGYLKNSFFIRIIERLELSLYKNADLLIPVTNNFKKKLISKGIPDYKIKVVTNGSDLSKFKPIEKDTKLVSRYDLKNKFVLGYIGTHGMAHSLETIIDSAKIMEEKSINDIAYILLGDGARKAYLKNYVKEIGLKNVIFIDTVSRDEIVNHWSILDVSIIHLKNTNAFKSVIPSKLFESMAMGIPVLHGVFGESREIVIENSSGLPFAPENSYDLSEKILELKNNKDKLRTFGNNGISSSLKYDRHYLALSMLDFLKKHIKYED
tara:strand:- start:5158 stop:6390 length:1233 start_codon:yes stop_codon:yes gene_type:complete